MLNLNSISFNIFFLFSFPQYNLKGLKMMQHKVSSFFFLFVYAGILLVYEKLTDELFSQDKKKKSSKTWMKNFHIYFVTNKTFTLEIIQKEEFLTLTIKLDKKKK